MKRRDFVKTFVTGTAGAVILQACGGGSDTSSGGDSAAPPTSTAPTSGDTTATDTGMVTSCTETIANNHGHTLEVSAADVAAGEEKTYDIQGSAPHTHSVTVTAADFQILESGGTVTKTSTTGAGHTHGVTIQCA